MTVEARTCAALLEHFHSAHERRYGYRMLEEPVEMVNLRLTATVAVERPALTEDKSDGDPVVGRREVNLDGQWERIPVLDRSRMGIGSRVEGPAVVEFVGSTCLVRPGWIGRVDEAGNLILKRDS